MLHKQQLRRRLRRSRPLFKLMVTLNIVAWLAFLVMMILIHYARPELLTGFQEMLGLEKRQFWLRELTQVIIGLQLFCILCGAVLLWMKHKTARRRGDSVWLNLFFLIGLSALSLIWTYSGLSAL